MRQTTEKITISTTHQQILWLVVLGLACVVLRLPAYYEPFEQDITNHALIAHELLNGRLLYTDIWNHKPPMAYLTYALAELLTGYGPHSVFLLNILTALISLGGVYYATRLVADDYRAGLWAAACWTAISAYIPLLANQPNMEVFINACLIWALALLLKPAPTPRRLLIIGLLFVVASLYKQITVVASMTLAMAYILLPPAGIDRRRAMGHMLLVGLVGVVGWAATAGYFALQSRFTDFYEAVFGFNHAYATEIRFEKYAVPRDWGGMLRAGFTPARFLPAYFTLGWPLFALLAGGLVMGLWQRRRQWAYVAAYVLAVPVMIALPGKFFAHYYQFWLPILAVAAGVVIFSMGNSCRKCSVGIGMLFLATLFYLQWPLLRLSPLEISERKYGTVFIRSEQAGQAIGKLLEPGETFYQWGAESGLFFYSRRAPASGIFFNYPLLAGPYTNKYLHRVMRDLQQKKPELIVLPRRFHYQGHPAVQVLEFWVKHYYVPHPDNPRRDPEFQFYLRRGGRLAPE